MLTDEPTLSIVNGYVTLKDDEGNPTGKSRLQSFIRYGNGLYPLSYLLSLPPLQASQIEVESNGNDKDPYSVRSQRAIKGAKK